MAERLDDLCASFKRDLRAEGKAPRTCTLYGMSVDMFGAWLAELPDTLGRRTMPSHGSTAASMLAHL